MEILLLLISLGIIIIIWYESLRIREQLILRCQFLCKEAELQLLDQTVAMASLSIGKSISGTPCLKRRYQFEVSENGTERYTGYVNLLGRHIVMISFDGAKGTVIYDQKDFKRLQ